MAFIDHIARCNRFDPAKFVPLMVDSQRAGWVRRDLGRHLATFPEAFRVSHQRVQLHPGLDSPAARSDAVDRVVAELNQRMGTPRLRGERYKVVAERFADPMLMTVDRGVVSLLGVRAFGIHVNGFVRTRDGLALWIGRRALDKAVAPGKLDNMVAGGQPAHLSLKDNLLKEAAEEADIPANLAAQARPVGAISYCLEDDWGLKPDLMYCFDLELPADFTPRNTDGEIIDFVLMPIEEVARRVRDTDDFKFNVNLVIIDFLIRHGVLCPDSEPDYALLVAGLRR
jgi:hypothetical protein